MNVGLRNTLLKGTAPASVGLLCLAVLCSGCRTYDQQVREIRTAYQAGNYGQAADLVSKRLEGVREGRDELIWTLEAATLMRSAGRQEESSSAFGRADAIYEDYQQKAKVSIGSESLSLLTNPAKLPYRGRSYDGIMISVYQALDALCKGDGEAARVFINRTYQRQQDAVADHAAKIEKEQEQIKSNKDLSKTMENPKFNEALSRLSAADEGLEAYADYVNPFAVYLDGLYHWNAGVDQSDVQRAQKCFERVMAFAPDNPYVKEDFESAMKAAAPNAGAPVCYVLFETGSAPSRDAVRIDIPILVTRVSYVGVSFPKLVKHGEFVPALTVEAGAVSKQTQRVASMDAIIAQDFKNELPSIIARATASAVAKAAAAYALNTAAKQAGGDGAALAAQIMTAAYQIAMNVADTRTWNTLPKEFQVCKVAIPEGRRIALAVPEQGWRQELTLNEGNVVVVWAKAVAQSRHMTVTQFAIKK